MFNGDTVSEAIEHLEVFEATDAATTVGRVAKDFAAKALVGSELGASPTRPTAAVETEYRQAQPAQQQGYAPPQQGGYTQPQQQAPQQGQQGPPPGLVAPTCPHGTKRYVVGQYGPFWGCPADRQDPSKCRPQKIRQ